MVLPYYQTVPTVITKNIISNAENIKGVHTKQYNGDDRQWTPDKVEQQSQRDFNWRSIQNNIIDCIGCTPIIRINNFAKHYGIKCDLVAKCEFLNPGGSTKDRIGRQMIESAENTGILNKTSTLIEASSGNTGIGLALCAAVKGYPMIITLPNKMSAEKCTTLMRLGAEIVRTPNVPWNDPMSSISMAGRLSNVIDGGVNLDQYTNGNNPAAHYYGTGTEIIDQCNGHIDMIVAGAGTGGTITGVAKIIKERISKCIVVCVDPFGSSLALPSSMNVEHLGEKYMVEGIGYDFIPDVLNRQYVDKWVKTDDIQAYTLARDLIRLEGLLVGGSSGSALAGVLEAAKSLTEGQRCVVILPDSIRNYMSKFANDQWMQDNGFIDIPPPQIKTALNHLPAESLCLTGVPNFEEETTFVEAMRLFSEFTDLPAIPFLQIGEILEGVVTRADVNKHLMLGLYNKQSRVQELLSTKFREVSLHCPIYEIVFILEVHPFVVITSKIKNAESQYSDIVRGIVDQKSLFTFLNN